MEYGRGSEGSSSSSSSVFRRKDVKGKPLEEINGKEKNGTKRRRIFIQSDEERNGSSTRSGVLNKRKTDSEILSLLSTKGSAGLETAAERLDDFEWDQDDEEALVFAAAMEEDKLSTAAVIDSQENVQSNSSTPYCGCPTPVKDPRKTLVDSHHRYIITKFLYNRQEPAIKTMATAYSMKNERSLKSTKLILRDSWARTPILSEGTLVNIVDAEPDENGVFILERDHGFLVVEPDRLISVTNVASQCWCERKVAFSERIRFPIDNTDTLRGTIAHELISRSMLKKLKIKSDISSELLKVLGHADMVEKAYGMSMSQKALIEMGEELVDWVLMFNKQRMLSRDGSQKWKIENVRDIEDCYWSPEFGIKGKIDCSVEVRTESGETMVVPLEFKTGNPRFIGRSNARSEHTGQVQLYTLLMRNSLGLLHNNGILHYIRENHLVECSAALRDLQALIMARNRVIFNTPLNGNKGPFASLPNPAGVDFNIHCQRCEYRSICAVSVKLKNENSCDKEEKSEVERKLEASIGYLTEKELAFFDKWLRVINLEADEDEKSFDSKNLWLKSIAQRETDGKCLGDLHFAGQINDQTSTVLASFSIPRSKRHCLGNIFERDFVVLGTERDPCICYGSVESITNKIVVISIERSISERYSVPGVTFTLDKISSNSAGMMQFVYISNLMEDTPEATRMRSYLIEKKQLDFIPMKKKDITVEQERILSQHNKMQRVAMLKSLQTDSFLLVKGSPGCGKTSTIVGLIRLLVARNKTVLVSAYTSNAVDNILLSYKKYDTNFIRIGTGGKLKQDELAKYSTSVLRKQSCDVDKLREIYNSTPVVATTLLSLKHPMLKIRKFDYCIIDEGSQALPTAVFGIVLLARKCVIFGDPNQLPATIKSKEVKRMGIEDSMFSLYSQPENTCDLTIQYRMNQYIMKVANELLYGNQMKCASDTQAKEYLVISGSQVKNYLMESIPLDRTRKWLCISASRRPERSIIFFNTENIGAYEKVVSSTLQNKREKDIALAIIPMLLVGGISLDDIGVIAPYRGQVYLLRESLLGLGLNIEVNTVDQYQGREKNIIIVSFTKSLMAENEYLNEEGILNDVRRLNVAITRARAKVILIGNGKTLRKFPACRLLLSLLSDTQQYQFTTDDFYCGFFKDDE